MLAFVAMNVSNNTDLCHSTSPTVRGVYKAKCDFRDTIFKRN